MKKKTNPSFRYISVGFSCCGDDFIQTTSSRYDLERLGCTPAPSANLANFLIIQGTLNEKLATEATAVYDKMNSPKYVMALGTCACGGGLFPLSANLIPPVDVFVTGCPPRPEAIMNGVISLQEKASQGPTQELSS